MTCRFLILLTVTPGFLDAIASTCAGRELQTNVAWQKAWVNPTPTDSSDITVLSPEIARVLREIEKHADLDTTRRTGVYEVKVVLVTLFDVALRPGAGDVFPLLVAL